MISDYPGLYQSHKIEIRNPHFHGSVGLQRYTCSFRMGECIFSTAKVYGQINSSISGALYGSTLGHDFHFAPNTRIDDMMMMAGRGGPAA
jgi:hypothetical protein